MVSPQYVGQGVDEERAYWIRHGRQPLQHQRRQYGVATQQYEEAPREQLHHAAEHANTTANLEMTQRVQTLESSSEARFSTQRRELLSRLSIEAYPGTGRSATTLVHDKREEQSQIIHKGAREEDLRQEIRASQQAIIANELRENFLVAQMQEQSYRGLYDQSRSDELTASSQ